VAITWLADVLRSNGLTVVEHAGWQTRTVGGTWTPQFGIVHATAAPSSQSDTDQIRIVRDGRSDLDGPIANACVDRAGRWHVLAAGRCNTTIAGTAGPYEGKGNTYALGVEACHNNLAGTAWPDAQYDAYVRGWAAIARRLGWTTERLRGHKEHTPGHKTDPTFDMGLFRRRVAAVLAGEDNDVGTLEGVQAAQLKDSHFVLTSVPTPAGDRVPAHVALGTVLAVLEKIAGKVDIDDAELVEIRDAARAGAAAAADDIVLRVLAGLPEGTLTKDDVAGALREVLLTGAAPQG
jgi:hypothetical protein